MERGDTGALDSAIHYDALAARCLAGLVSNEQFKADFIRGMRRNSLGKELRGTLGQLGSYRLVRLHKSKEGGGGGGGEPCLLFRYVSGRLELNYHDLVLGRDARGEVRIVDVYNYSQGQPVSRTMRFLVAAALADGDQSMRRFVAAKPDLDKVLRMHGQVEGDYRGAWAAYERLPEALRRERSLMLARVGIAGRMNAATYARALEEYNRAYPNDPALDFVTLLMVMWSRKTEQILAAIDRIDKQLGGDPYLDLLRARANFDAGRRAQGKRDLERFLAFAPSMAEGYCVGIDWGLRARDWAAVVRMIKMGQANTNLPLSQFDYAPAMAEFLRTAEYRQWRHEEAVRNGLAGERR
jgi:tetratricopeptide (TPR) repeat protein